MILNGKKVVVLYLEDWQQRTIKDFIGVDCETWEIPLEGQITPLYMVPLPQPSMYKRMYLTDWQMRGLRDEAGMTCDFIELKKDSPIVPLYAVHTK